MAIEDASLGLPALFADRHMNVQFARTLGYAAYDAAAVGECFVAAADVNGQDRDTWAPAWARVAEEVSHLAEASAARGMVSSARSQFLRAFNYYRNAEFYVRPSDALKQDLFRKSQVAFERAMARFDHPAERIAIPYLDTHLPGFFWRVDDKPRPRPTIILHGGGDASGEEMYLMGGLAALRRGYNVLTFEGPGQRGFLYDNPDHPYRPDYEHVVTPVFDWALKHEAVDPERVVFSAISFGGYTGSRAMAHEHRARAFVVNAPMTSFYDLLVQSFQMLAGVEIAEDVLVERLDQLMQMKVPAILFAIEQLFWILGTKTIPETLDRMKAFRLNGVERAIRTETLCLFAEAEAAEGRRQLAEFTGNLAAPFEVIRFAPRSGANTHCMLNNYPLLYEEMFDWLEPRVQPLKAFS